MAAAACRPASLSHLWRLAHIAGTTSSFRCPLAQQMTFFSSSRDPSGFVLDRLPSSRSNFHRSSSTCSLSPSASAARFYRSAQGLVRRFGSAANRSQRQTTKRHLYLVLDDQELAYNIHKLDIDNDDLEEGISSRQSPRHLPEQPVLSVPLETIGPHAQFAAFGSHIIAMSPDPNRTPMMHVGSFGSTLSFNIKTAALTVSGLLPMDLRYGYKAAIAAGNRLYVFESCAAIYNNGLNGFYFCGGLHCLAADPKDDEKRQNWRPLCDSSRLCWSWDDPPPEFPFDRNTITAHAVHPRTGAIFVSANGIEDRRIWGAVKRYTFSYGAGSGKWRRRAKWLLPFQGHADYDDELGAWVGLHLHSGDTNGDNSVDGHLSAGNVMSGWQPPKWKFTREQLLLKSPHLRHVDVKLIHMGEGSKYLLMERLLPEGADKMKYVLCLSTFIVKYGENGELKTMGLGPARFYKAPSYRHNFDVQAFWM